jgi:hypothetical protein
MKATTIIIIAALSIQCSILFAGNDFPPLTLNNDASTSCCVSLVPVTPAEATFEDNASFDNIISEEPSIVILAPVTPAIADFEDDDDVMISLDYGMLAPVAPAEATFE